jgi:simple sugar transport system permease protein
MLFGKKLVFYPQLLDMLPYLATIVMLLVITGRKKQEYQSPAGLGQPYFREER